MWHEARKQEKSIRTMMVDHRKRAERRRDYYEKIKLDPNQFLQVHGRPCKIHLDPAVAAAAEAPATMMPWQGDKENMIDRFDGRAHLDWIPEVFRRDSDDELDADELRENRFSNYERYRILIQNDFLKIPEEKFLRTIELEEKFGGKTYQQQKAKDDKKKAEKGKAAIGFVYDDSTQVQDETEAQENDEKSDSESSSDSEMDLDMTVDFMSLSGDAQLEINAVGKNYELGTKDFVKFLARDIEEAQELRNAKQQEEEKAMFSGRKSRRERRLLREKRLRGRKVSPPSYAARESPSYGDYRSRFSSSRSPSPETSGKVEFITSFGTVSDDESAKPDLSLNPGLGVKAGLKRLKDIQKEEDRIVLIGPMLPDSSAEKKSRRKSRSKSRDRDRKRGRSRSRDRKRKSRSRSRSRDRRRRSRSSSRGRGGRKRRSSSRNGRRKKSRSRTPPSKSSRNRSRTPEKSKTKPEKSKKKKRSSSSSSSSSSDGEAVSNTKYRSKYRNRRRSSSSSSSSSGRGGGSKKAKADGKGNRPKSSDDEFVERPLFQSVEVVKEDKEVVRVPSPKPVKRYYGRRVQKSDSELSDLEQDVGAIGSDDSRTNNSAHNIDKAGANSQKVVVDTVKDKIRKKMQAQIRKRFKADKKAEEEKRQREEEERLFREEEMRELAARLRQREKRSGRWPGDSDRSSRSRSSSPESKKGRSEENKNGNSESVKSWRNKSRSPSPQRRRERRRSTSASPTRARRASRRSRSLSRDRRSRQRRSRSRSGSPGSPNIATKKIKLVDF